MICFCDMTFCAAPCLTRSCARLLTDEVRAAAARWWGGEDPPIALSDFRDTCGRFYPRTESVQPASEAVNATVPCGAEALAKSKASEPPADDSYDPDDGRV